MAPSERPGYTRWKAQECDYVGTPRSSKAASRYYRKKAEECRSHAAAAKHVEVEDSWHKLAAHWERLARSLDAAGQQATGQHAQQRQTKEPS
jgi:hypothetical protein